mgnify:CR=1 FL=1
MARRKFTREFKLSAVKLVNEQGYSVVDAAKSLGVDPNSVRGWVGKYSSEPGLAPSGEGAMAADSRSSASRWTDIAPGNLLALNCNSFWVSTTAGTWNNGWRSEMFLMNIPSPIFIKTGRRSTAS